MNRTHRLSLALLALLALTLAAPPAPAVIDGVTGTSFDFAAQTGRITTAGTARTSSSGASPARRAARPRSTPRPP